MKKTIEQQTAQTILDEPEEITINGRKYTAPSPTPATTIAVSAIVSEMPRTATGNGNIIQFVLKNAKDCEPMGQAIAVMILGKKRPINPIIDRYRDAKTKKLASIILHELSNEQLSTTFTKLLARMEIPHFFAISTFLIEINMLQATRGVEKRTTASGQ